MYKMLCILGERAVIYLKNDDKFVKMNSDSWFVNCSNEPCLLFGGMTMLKRMSWILVFVAVFMILCGLTVAQAADTSGTYDGISWRVVDKKLILGTAGETQTLTYRDSRVATDWPWYRYEKVYNESNMSYDYGINSIDVEGTIIAQGSLQYMFADMRIGMYGADFEGLDTSLATNMSYMFTHFYSFVPVDLSCFDTSHVTDMSFMFYACAADYYGDSTHFDFETWDTSNVTTMNRMFDYSHINGGLYLSCFDTSNVTDMDSMFFHCVIVGSHDDMSGDSVLDISNFSFPKVRNSVSVFSELYVDEIIFNDRVEFTAGTSLGWWFQEAHIASLDLSSWDVSTVGNMNSIFRDASLQTLNLDGWNPASCRIFTSMFSGCSSLSEVNVSGWDTGYGVAFDGMFSGCSSLQSIDVSSFTFGNATSVAYMFSGCSKLTELDVSSWVLEDDMDVRRLFANCRNVKELDVSGFVLENGVVTELFYGCNELVRVKLGEMTVFRMADNDSVCYLPATTQTNEYAYTGRWVREDEAYGPYTPEELTQYYQMNMAGWWVLEKDFPTAYIVLVEDDDNTAYIVIADSDTIFAGGTVQTVPSISGEEYTGIVYPIDFEEARTWGAIATRVKHVIVVDRLMPPTISDWFTGFSACEDFELDLLDTSLVTSFAGLFNGCSSFVAFDASDLEMENVTNMSSMFAGCSSLTSFDSEDFNTSNVTTMSGMFRGCSSMTSFDFTDNFDTSKVTTMSSMFQGCSGVTSLDLSMFNVDSVTTMSAMFNSCSSLETLNTNEWNTGNVVDLSSTFYGTKFSSLDLTHWDVSNVQYMGSLFYNCKATGDINLTGWDVKNVKDASSFGGGFTGHLIMPNMTWSSLTSSGNMFYSRSLGSVLDIPNWSFGQLPSTYYMFAFGYGDVNAENWDLTGVTTISNTFRQTNGGTDGTTINVKGWHSNTVTNARQMFEYSSGLKYIHMEDWNFPNLENMESTFGACSRLTNIYGIEDLNVSKVTNMSMLFYNDSELEDVDLSSWDADLSGNISNMFYCCRKLTHLDLHGLRTSGITYMSSVFTYCLNLEYLDISGFDASGLTSSSYNSFFDGFGTNHNLRTVVLGDKNPFQGGAYTGSGLELPQVPLEKNGVHYSGKWIREDYLYGPYTPTELRTNYQPSFEGVWIWDESLGSGYTIVFEAPEGTLGSMPLTFVPAADQAFMLPENKFRRPGAHFSYWYEETLNRQYTTGIGPNSYEPGQIVVLRAVFDSDGGGAVNMSGGGFEISLKKNQKAIFTGIPADTEYQVYEKTPSGWVLISEEDSSGIVESNSMSSAAFLNKFTPNQCSLILRGDKFFNDSSAEKGEFQFELLDEDGNVISTTTTGAGGNIVFDALTFTEADVGREIYYTVREVLPGKADTWESPVDEGITYDVHEETIKVIVSYQLSDKTVIVSSTDNFDEYGERIDPFIPLDEPIVRYFHSTNMTDEMHRDMIGVRSDGSIKGDYESNKIYASIVTIPNAAKLHLRIEYTNPRGTFWLWQGAHDEVKTGVWSSECNSDNAFRRFSGSTYDERLVTELDILGDSFSCYYNSYALPTVASNYNESSNFGYHITVTVTELVKSGYRRADGSFKNDYSSNTPMSDVVTIPGAEKLHVEMTYSKPRGNFWIWEGAHPEIGNGTSSFGADFSPSTALKVYSWTSADDNTVFSDSFDVDGDSLTVYYSSWARPQTDTLYGENVNYGYCMKVTPVGLSGQMSGYNVTSSTPNIWSDGTQHGNYATGKDYVDVVTIPGAKNLQFRIYFNMGSNDRLRLFKGNHPEYTNDTNANYVGYMTGYTSGYYTYGVSGDTATFVFHADANSTGGNGFGYYAVVMPSNVLGELHAEADYDDDGAVFENYSETGYLSLMKASADTATSDQPFMFELSFYDEFGQLVHLDTDVEYHTDSAYLPTNLVTIYHIGRYGEDSEKTLYTERYPQIQSGESFTVKAKTFAGMVYAENDYVDELPVDGVVATAGENPLEIRLYYDAVPNTLTIRHQLYNENNTLIGTPYTETQALVEGTPIVLDLAHYDGYAYVGNSADLVVDGNQLVNGRMGANDMVISVKYRVARRINLFKGMTRDETTYHIKLDRYDGLDAVGDLTFVDGETDVCLTGDGEMVTFDVPAGTRLAISAPDGSAFNVKGTYYYLYSGTELREGSLGGSNQTLYSNNLTSAGPYNIGLYEDAQVRLSYKQVGRRENGTEYVTSSSAYRYPGERFGSFSTSTNTISERVSGTYVYYLFSGEQNFSSDDIVPRDVSDLDLILYYDPAISLKINYVRITNSGTQYTDGTYTSYGLKNGDLVFDPKTYSGYHVTSVEYSGDSAASLSVNENGQIVGHLGTNTLTLRIIYRQN